VIQDGAEAEPKVDRRQRIAAGAAILWETQAEQRPARPRRR
jgi:hypothetical protein